MSPTISEEDALDAVAPVLDALIDRMADYGTIVEYAYEMLRDRRLVRGEARCLVAMAAEIAQAADDDELVRRWFDRGAK